MIRYLKPKEFKRLHGNVRGIHYLNDNGQHIIEVPYHVSTMTKLHELAHQFNNDNGNCNITIDRLFDKELQAEIYAYKAMNRKLNISVAIPAVNSLTDLLPNYSNYIFNITLNKMNQYCIPYSRQEKSNLWNAIISDCKKVKQKRNSL